MWSKSKSNRLEFLAIHALQKLRSIGLLGFRRNTVRWFSSPIEIAENLDDIRYKPTYVFNADEARVRLSQIQFVDATQLADC